MILLDTNVVSALAGGADQGLISDWVDRLGPGTAWISTITAAELRLGVALLPDGRRKQGLDKWCETLIARFTELGCVAEFDLAASRHFAVGKAKARQNGREVNSFADAAIGAIALAGRCPVASRDTSPFEALGVEVIDPWSAAG
ncbi:MAG: PIN domain-containing protein [Litorimonas sp.]